jgi:HD-GYP domain-containing protein (c-di-GMP phosphodiesterase class II)
LAKNIIQNFAYTNVYIHEHMVEYYTKVLAQAIDIEMFKVSMAASLHDRGKLKWYQELFVKSRNELNDNDFHEILMHPKHSTDVILHMFPEKKEFFSKGDPSILDLIMYHHEKPDGTGYYKIKDITIEMAVISIADVFDACLSDRLYRKGLDIRTSIYEAFKDYSSFLEQHHYSVKKMKKALVKSAVEVRISLPNYCSI